MVYGEATITFPLLAGYIYHKGSWHNRQPRSLTQLFRQTETEAKA